MCLTAQSGSGTNPACSKFSSNVKALVNFVCFIIKKLVKSVKLQRLSFLSFMKSTAFQNMEESIHIMWMLLLRLILSIKRNAGSEPRRSDNNVRVSSRTSQVVGRDQSAPRFNWSRKVLAE